MDTLSYWPPFHPSWKGLRHRKYTNFGRARKTRLCCEWGIWHTHLSSQRLEQTIVIVLTYHRRAGIPSKLHHLQLSQKAPLHSNYLRVLRKKNSGYGHRGPTTTHHEGKGTHSGYGLLLRDSSWSGTHKVERCWNSRVNVLQSVYLSTRHV